MMSRALEITCDITKAEQPWMDADEIVKAGEVVYEFHDYTYGYIGNNIAVSRERGQTPFFEVPRDAVKPV